ncbi:hypothetical protein Hanom_Chr11g01018441 [Helianthus anomalus]
MFDEQENYDLEVYNRWFRGLLSRSYQDEKKKVWVNRLEKFLCNINEQLDELEKRYGVLIKYLQNNEIRMTEAEKISKFADALPTEWDEFLKNLRKNLAFQSYLYIGSSVNLKLIILIMKGKRKI